MNNQNQNQAGESSELDNSVQLKPTQQPVIPPADRSKSKKWMILAIIFGVLLLLGILGFVTLILFAGFLVINNAIIPSVEKVKTQQWAQQLTQIQVLDKSTQVVSPIIEGAKASCQPESFDPTISGDSSAQETGINRKLETINLSAGYVANVYSFSCASSSSYVIDLIKASKRIELYTHIDKYSFSDDNNYLFLTGNYEESGVWTKRKRIINIAENSVVNIPELDCTKNIHEPKWQGDRLMTFSNHDNPMEMTKVCVWSNDAKLVARLQMDVDWATASRDYINDQIGLLPNNHDVLYLYTDTQAAKMSNTGTCSLFLKDITNKQEAIPSVVLDKNKKSITRCGDKKIFFDFTNTKSVYDDFTYEIDG